MEKQDQQQMPMPQVAVQFQAPPQYSMDLLAPPQWIGPPGQLIPWSATSAASTGWYSVHGTDSQVLQVTLPPSGGNVFSEPGTMMYMAESIKMNTGMRGLGKAFKRALGGESMFQNQYVNSAPQPAGIAFGPCFPGKIIPVDLSKSGPIHCTPGVYMAHVGDVQISYRFVRNILAGCCGGSGFLLLKIQGSGTVFLTASGTIMEKILAPGEVLLADTEAIVGFAGSVEYGVRSTGGCCNCCCGGEGMFNTKLTGPGLVIVQSMSKKKLIGALGIYSSGAASGAAAGAAAGSAAAN